LPKNLKLRLPNFDLAPSEKLYSKEPGRQTSQPTLTNGPIRRGYSRRSEVDKEILADQDEEEPDIMK
jgi:hypothetical protein